jgi:hypothetical protein
MQVDRILDMDLHSAPFPMASPGDIVNELTARALARVRLLPELLAQVPQVLLLGRRGRGRELAPTTRRPGAPPCHDRDSHRQAFDEQAGVVGELPTQEEEAPVALKTGQQQPDETTPQQPGVELRADAELEELIRVLLGRSLGRVRSPHTTMVGFTSRPPPSPSSLAERWMR